MFIKRKKINIIQKALSIVLSLIIVIYPLIGPYFSRAEDEITPTPTPTEILSPLPDPQMETTPPVIEEITPTATPAESTPTPTTEPSSTIETGSSIAGSQSDTTANQNETEVSGNIATDGCQINGSIDCPVNTENTVENSGSSDTNANSGENTISGSAGDASIDSGDALANSTVNNNLNSNEINMSPADPTNQSAAENNSNNTINIDNNAQNNSTNNSSANSGENFICQAGGEADIKTGDTVAEASTANLINTNVIGSNYRFIVYNIYDEEKNLNLNQIYKDLAKELEGYAVSQTGSGALQIDLSNSAVSKDTVTASANSGNNTITDSNGNVTINTGNSYASANLLNIINTNIIGSRFVFVIVNIFGNFKGHIIVPNQERFAESVKNLAKENSLPTPASQINITNFVDISLSSAFAGANSGNNQSVTASGDNIIQTGPAYASATSFDIVNTTLNNDSWMRVLINNFGNWSGFIENWVSPGYAEKALAYGSTDLNYNGPEKSLTPTPTEEAGLVKVAALPEGSENTPTPTPVISELNNSAELTSAVSASANTGGNNTSGNLGSTIFTGTAIALANVFNLVNTTIIGSDFFTLIINVFGTWDGNFIAGTADLETTITGGGDKVSPGQETTYQIYYFNKGFETARDAKVKITLPKDALYISNSLGLNPEISGQDYFFSLGEVAEETGGNFTLRLKIKDNISPESASAGSFMARLVKIIIPPAFAEDFEKNLLVEANIDTIDEESDESNNTARILTTVIIHESKSTEEAPISPDVVLNLDSSHNVGEFVYPGDTVTFFVTLKNSGSTNAKNIVLWQNIHDGEPDPVATLPVKVGDLESGREIKITYGLTIPKGTPPDLYKSSITALGKDELDNEILSNMSRSEFLVRGLSELSLVKKVQAAEKTKKPSVLGATIPCKAPDYFWYTPVILILAALLGIDFIRRKKAENKLKQLENNFKEKI